MTLADGSGSNGLCREDTNGMGPPEAKRMRLDDSEQYIVCDCDVEAAIGKAISDAIANVDVHDLFKQEMHRFSTRLSYIDKLEREFMDVDIAFDRMENDLKDLQKNKSLERIALLSPPEIHFFDVFVKADSNFKMPEVASPRKAAVAAGAAPPRNGAIVAKGPGGVDEIIPVGAYTPRPQNLPPEGDIVRKELEISSRVLATRSFPLGVFYKARIIQIQEPSEEAETSVPTYRVKFEARKATSGSRALKWFHPRELAYADRPTVILPVGTRVVATYSDECVPPRQSLYAGLIAEPPKPLNRYRYLVFFDDGYAQYVDVDKVFVMCGTSKQVWEDMYRDVQDFVRNYLDKYPERPMLRLRKGQTVKTEWNGKWWMARVLTVDSSLVKMSFEADNRTEWIYRGSTRFAPLYTALNQSTQNTVVGGRVRRQNLMPAGAKQHKPFVQYTRSEDSPDKEEAPDGQKKEETEAEAEAAVEAALRNVARKSTTQDRKIGEQEGRNAYGVLLSQAGTRELCKQSMVRDGGEYKRVVFKPHKCSPKCVTSNKPDEHLGMNPLSIPCILGWERQVMKQSKKSKRRVYYVAPCGRRLRDIDEVVHYLRLTDSHLTIDQFCFDSCVNVFCEFKPAGVKTSILDITYGKEQVPVSCVNSLDQTYPTYVEYSSMRYPGKGVELNLDKEFLCGCDCEDDCQDREKCSCQQLTVAATEALPSGRNPEAGYHYRRLQEPHITGVYECNSQCRCSRRCMNRVAQNGLRCRLQVFKTEKRGWGIRCLDDLPQGSFVCVYAGQLLNEQGANEDGNQYGDEYLAELDHIEVVEKQKEGYESDVVNPSDEEDSDDTVDEDEPQDNGTDSDYDSACAELPRKRSSRLQNRKEQSMAEDSSDGKANDDEDEASNDGSGKSTRSKKEAKSSVNKENSPEKSADDESSDSKSTEDKPSDQTEEKDVKPTVGPMDSPSEKETETPRFPSTRSFFNEEYCYIMDAKNCGNIGRYLNHSCSPNVYVQNVFVDSHDLRFPWVAFFAARYIRAGVELTWDYNYDVGSVPERVMYCQCGSEECRGRLI